MTLKGHGNFGLLLNPAFQISPPKIGQFVSSKQKGSKFNILLLFLLWKVNSYNQKPSLEFYFVTWKVWAKIESCFANKTKKEIGQFLSSGLKGSKFHISFLSILWKVNCLNQKTFTGVLLCNTEGPCKVWSKIELCFPNKPPKKCSIYFERAKRVQISNFLAFFCLKSKLPEPKIFRGVLFGDAKDPCKVCAKIGLCFPNKPQKNWLICFQRAKRVQILDFIAFFFVWRVNGLNQKNSEQFYFVTLKSHAKLVVLSK